MISAAVSSSFFVLRIRSPRMSGITATPVSNPDSPSASLGNMITDTASMSQTLPCWCQSCCLDRKSTRLNSSHLVISYAVFCLKKKKNKNRLRQHVHEVDY